MSQSRPSERQIQLYAGGNYSLLKDYMDGRTVVRGPNDINTQEVAVVTANFVLIDDTMVAGNLAVGSASTTTNGGIQVAALATAVGTASATVLATDSMGNKLNLIEIRDASTNDPLLDTDGRQIFGLLQSDSGAADGAAIGTTGAENVQISFVKYNASSVLTLVTINTTIGFNVNYLFSHRFMPTLRMESSGVPGDMIDVTSQIASIEAHYLITTAFPANDVITLSTGDGTTGVSTATGDAATITLPASSGLFASNARVRILRNGVDQEKGVDVVYNSATTFHFTAALDVNEQFTVIAPSAY